MKRTCRDGRGRRRETDGNIFRRQRANRIGVIRCIQGTLSFSFVPILTGSAFKNEVQPLLDAFIDYLPSPSDLSSIEGTKVGSEEKVTMNFSEKEKFSALAFKVANDPFVGSLTFIRIYSGTLNAGTSILNSSKDKDERIGRMLLMHANSREDIKSASAGDIIALAGLKYTITGHTVCDQTLQYYLNRWNFLIQ